MLGSVGGGKWGLRYPLRDGNSPNYPAEVIPVLHYGRHHADRPSVSHIIFVFITLRLWPYISPRRDIAWRVDDILPALLSGTAQFLPPSTLLPWVCNYKSDFIHAPPKEGEVISAQVKSPSSLCLIIVALGKGWIAKSQ